MFGNLCYFCRRIGFYLFFVVLWKDRNLIKILRYTTIPLSVQSVILSDLRDFEGIFTQTFKCFLTLQIQIWLRIISTVPRKDFYWKFDFQTKIAMQKVQMENLKTGFNEVFFAIGRKMRFPFQENLICIDFH